MAAEPIASAPMRAAALARLLAGARHEASILEHHLESDIHDDEAVLAALRSLAASGRGARIRILVQDTSRLQVEAPRLLALVQRMSSAMSIRVPSEPADLAYGGAFTTVDGWPSVQARGLAARYPRAIRGSGGTCPFTGVFRQPVGTLAAGGGTAPDRPVDLSQGWRDAARGGYT